MKTYFRVLAYYLPLWKFMPQYLVLALLGILFGLLNFTLLIPLLKVLFEKTNLEVSAEPTFALSVEYLKALFDYHFTQVANAYGSAGALKFVCLVVGISVFLSAMFRYFAFRIINTVRVGIVRNLRNDVYQHITRLHLAYFTNERKGDLMSRMVNDLQEIEGSMVNTVRAAFKGPMTILVYFGALFYISLEMTLFTLVFLPITGGLIAELTKRLKKHGRTSQDLLGQLLGMIDQTLSGIKIIKAFTAEGLMQSRFGERNQSYARVSLKTENKRDLASPLSEFLGVWVMLGVILYGGTLVLEGNFSSETFIAYLVIFSQIISPIKTFSNMIGRVQRGLVAAERVFDLLEIEPQIKSAAEQTARTSFTKSIRFSEVSFAYQTGRNVLSNINFELKKGEMIALVGPSGGGKSTLADLLPRFYDPTTGKILLDGKDIREHPLQNLRSLMGIVTQEALLFNDSIFNNIAFGKPEATLEEVIQAAKIANAHEFISQMSEGYSSGVGESGGKLSGGQRQRISIARAVLKNPDILILDEATSALDSESEQLVQEALQNLMKNRTSLVIAHRLSTIKHADRILVIQRGQIVEAGKHEELLAQKRLYAKLVEMQQVGAEIP